MSDSVPANIAIKYKYPHFGDIEFQKKIALKQEFKYPYTVPNGQISNNKLCQHEEFVLSPHQEFIKNFIHPSTPYNGILLYHGMGTGKTCTAIGVTEQFRHVHKYNKNFNKIWVIASTNVQENFKLQLFNIDKLEKKNGIWNLDSCVGPALLQELQNYDLQNMDKHMIADKINDNIQKYYVFSGYVEFANKIGGILRNINVKDEKKRYRIVKEKLNTQFGNCLLVIDEAHNVRDISEGGKKTSRKRVTSAMKLLTTYVKKNKILLLSGTPMYNDSREIIFLLNILRRNDGLSEIKLNEVFDKNGNLLINEEGEAIGEKILTIKANGYISFVRGENPYIFPFKIYPSDYNSKYSTLRKGFVYPDKQYNGDDIPKTHHFLDLYMTKMSEKQLKVYKFFTKKKLEKPSNGHVNGDESIIGNEAGENYMYTELHNSIYALNITYPTNKPDEYLVGKNGLDSVVVKDEHNKFKYRNKDKNIFDEDKIGDYSAKIKSILEIIKQSKGIILIYSQFKDAGLLPLALALEELGMTRLNPQDNLFSKSARKNEKKIFPKKYTMITGDANHSRNNYRDIKIINKAENVDGDLCKIVLITQAGSEGIDFKNLRQVHILEPWWNLNRMDQIVGRAIRNCSHKDLDIKNRNCQIFLHGTYIDAETESVDMMVYRKCEEKARKIGKVQSILKSVSIDCIINENQKDFAKLEEELEIELSTNDKIDKKFSVRDKPYSLVCDYQKNCEYKCQNDSLTGMEPPDKTTFAYHHSLKHQLIRQIKKLFLKRHVYKFEEIAKECGMEEKDIDTYSALTYLVNNEAEIILDKFGKKGRIINAKNLYVFQPIELNDSYSSLYDKMRPLKHKPLCINVSKHRTKSSENDEVVVTGTNGLSSKVVMNSSITASGRTFEKIVNNFEIGMKINGSLKDKSKDFYTNYALIVQKLKELSPKIKISEKQKQKWLVEHILESMPFKHELALVNYIFQDKTETELMSMCKNYYEKNFIFKFMEGQILFLIDLADKNSDYGDKAHLYDSHIKLYYKPKEEIKFKPLTQSQKKEGQGEIIRILKSVKLDKKKFGKYIVFIGHYEKDKNSPNQLKTKKVEDMHKSKKNKGRVFKNEIPKDMYPVLNSIIGEEVITPRIFIKEQLAVVLEIVSKYFSKKDNIVFINKLQNAENNVKEL